MKTFSNRGGLLRGFCVMIVVAAVAIPTRADSTQKLKGRIFAYNLAAHLIRLSSVANQEIVVLKVEVPQNKEDFIKVVVSRLGGDPLDPAAVNNGAVLELTGRRETHCDETNPKILDQKTFEQKHQSTGSGEVKEIKLGSEYLLSNCFAREPIPMVKTLPCYQVDIESK